MASAEEQNYPRCVLSQGGARQKKRGGGVGSGVHFNLNGKKRAVSIFSPIAFPLLLSLYRHPGPSGVVHSQAIIFDGEEVSVLLGSW